MMIVRLAWLRLTRPFRKRILALLAGEQWHRLPGGADLRTEADAIAYEAKLETAKAELAVFLRLKEAKERAYNPAVFTPLPLSGGIRECKVIVPLRPKK